MGAVVERKEIQGRGRGLVATQVIKAGDIILRESPIVVYSAIPFTNKNKYCSHCFRSITQTETGCPKCSSAIFCSSLCQTLSNTCSHTPWVCCSLQHIHSSSLLSSQSHLLIQLYFLISAYNLSLTSPPNFHLLLSLQGHPPQTLDPQTLTLHSLISSLSPPPPASSPHLTAALLAKDKLNAFGLMEPFRPHLHNSTVRAYAIYPNASFFNHDCLPNACRFDYLDTPLHHSTTNTDIIVRAITQIPQGREVSLSYFPVNWNYVDRQRRLVHDYGFSCDCDRCMVEINWKDNDAHQQLEEDDDDDHQQMASSSEEDDNTDFPHAYFFLNFVCDQDNCSGTLAPLPPSQEASSSSHSPVIMECNVCGRMKPEQEIHGFANQDATMLDDSTVTF